MFLSLVINGDIRVLEPYAFKNARTVLREVFILLSYKKELL